MILDLSHLSDEGVEDVLSITSCPVIASHSNSRAVAGSNRNLTDSQMREIASRGGTVGLNGCSLLTAGPGVPPDQNGLTAHLDHMTEIMGEDHVALGFDFCDSFFADDLSSSTDQMPERPFDILSRAHEDLPALPGPFKAARVYGKPSGKAGRGKLAQYLPSHFKTLMFLKGYDQ